MNHLMIDIETLGISPNTVVLSIGAVVFNTEGVVAAKEYILNPNEQIKLGRQVDFSTITWWMNQGAEAKELFRLCEKSGLSIEDALRSLSDVYTGTDVKRVWANGASFDLPIMASLFKDANLTLPWKYWDERCYRTIKAAAGLEKQGIVRGGVKHSALADALFQAENLITYLKIGKI